MRRKHLSSYLLLFVLAIMFFAFSVTRVIAASDTKEPTRSKTIVNEVQSVVPEIKTQNRMFFSGIGQRIADFFSMINTSVNQNLGIPDKEKIKISKELNSDISWFQREAISISITEDENKLQAKIVGLKDFWLQREYRIKYYINRIISGQVLNAIDHLEALEPKFIVLVKRLDQEKIDTTNIKRSIDTFTRSLKSARSAYNLALGQMEQINSNQNQESVYQASKAALNESHKNLQQARAHLQLLIRDIKKEAPSFTSTTQPLIPS